MTPWGSSPRFDGSSVGFPVGIEMIIAGGIRRGFGLMEVVWGSLLGLKLVDTCKEILGKAMDGSSVGFPVGIEILKMRALEWK